MQDLIHLPLPWYRMMSSVISFHGRKRERERERERESVCVCVCVCASACESYSDYKGFLLIDDKKSRMISATK